MTPSPIGKHKYTNFAKTTWKDEVTVVRVWQCDKCPKTYTNFAELKNHLANKHSY